ncbi:MAG TPA: hypothetical protein VFS67_13450, partial [Polyangiaceae bacterium]|nr:hypothetical protein [Polyangiaceae bacterium]
MLFLLTLFAVGSTASAAHAYPWMIRHGFAQCGSCHVDPMGGETLTGMGRVMGEALLAMPWAEDPPSDASKFLFGVTEPENLHLGGSLRVMSLTSFDSAKFRTFPMQADLTGAGTAGAFTLAGSIGVSKASNRYEHSSKARVFGDVEGEDYIMVARNYWLGYRFGRGWMVRAGRLNLPFGIRTSEHTMWVRSETLTDRESDQDHGISALYAAGRWRGELMLSLGNFQRPNDALRERGYSGYLEYLFAEDFALGVSSLVLRSEHELNVDDGPVLRQAHGLTARYVFSEPLVLLAEADVLAKTRTSLGYVAMATLDVELLQGLHLAGTGELLDRGTSEGSEAGLGRGKPDPGAWLTVDWFFAPHFELRTDLVLRQQRGQT